MKNEFNKTNLSIIIAFRNEGLELINTLQEIRNTVGDAVDVITIDDASCDNFDYKSALIPFNVLYIRNKDRKGCAPSREVGIDYCKTSYFFIIDAHMRFYDTQWAELIAKALKEDERAIYCCQCVSIDYETKEKMPLPNGGGAYLYFLHKEERGVLNLKWIKNTNLSNEEKYIDIPCVLGACYAASKDYWHYLRGLKGLKYYSCDEQYISLKAWMEGGRCRLIKNIKIGHLFRDNPPYEMSKTEFYYNKLFIIKTILPIDLGAKMIKALKSNDYIHYSRAANIIASDTAVISDFRKYYSTILKNGIESFLKINNHFSDEF